MGMLRRCPAARSALLILAGCVLGTCVAQTPGEGGEELEARLEAVLDVVRGLCAGDPLSCAPASCIAPDGMQLSGNGDRDDAAGERGACELEGGELGGGWPGADVRSAGDKKFEEMVPFPTSVPLYLALTSKLCPSLFGLTNLVSPGSVPSKDDGSEPQTRICSADTACQLLNSRSTFL